jgi:hypothetical protein
MYPQQRRQFIPHGAIKSVGIVVVFFRCGFVMTYVQFLFSQWLGDDLAGLSGRSTGLVGIDSCLLKSFHSLFVDNPLFGGKKSEKLS